MHLNDLIVTRPAIVVDGVRHPSGTRVVEILHHHALNPKSPATQRMVCEWRAAGHIAPFDASAEAARRQAKQQRADERAAQNASTNGDGGGDLASLTKDQLIQYAVTLGLDLNPRLSKNELIAEIESAAADGDDHDGGEGGDA